MSETAYLHTSQTYLPGKKTLGRKYFTSPKIYKKEMKRIYSKNWVCIGRLEMIPEAADYRIIQIGNESLIIVRDQEARLHAFYNLCRHRGTRICDQETGRFANSIQCPYHAWTYGLDGRLIGAPLMDEVPDFQKADYPLHQASLHEWAGFLFVNLDPESAPFPTVFPALSEKFSNWELANLRSMRRQEYDIQANWKLIVQNYSECYHCPLIHPDLAQRSPYRSGHNDFFEGPLLGGYMEIDEDFGSLTLSGRACATPFSHLKETDLDRVYYYWIFPNLLLSLHPDYVMYHTIRPLAANRTRVICEWLFDPAQQDEPGFNPDDAAQFWDKTNRQDWKVCELSQSGIQSKLYSPSPYSPAESLLAAFDQQYLHSLEQSNSRTDNFLDDLPH